MSTTRDTLAIGGVPATRRDGFEPLYVLSTGPDGTAVLARSITDGTECELRFVSALRADRERWIDFAHRCALLERLQGRGVRRLLFSDLDGEQPLVAIEPARGMPLAQWATQRGPLDDESLAAVLEPIAFALGAAHRLSIAHGALGPETVWIDEGGEIALEFTGLDVLGARSAWAEACLAPERSRWSTPEPSADLYALGSLGLGLRNGGQPQAKPSDTARDDGLTPLLEALMAHAPDERPTAAEWTLSLREWRARRASLRQTQQHAELVATSQDRGSEHPSALREGAQLGRYYLVRRLGEGGMGEVWEGLDLGTGASVAVKVMRPEVAMDAVFLRRFRKEARTLAAVRSPYTANFIELNEDRGLHFMVMEFVEGRSVASVLEERGPFSERDALAIIADACRALVEPHRVGIVHRDIKPDNLMFVDKREPREDADERRQRVKLCDFGIAREAEVEGATKMTQDGMLLGTPAYMSPEQCRGESKVGPSSDVYSLGATLFELLTGRIVFDGDTPMAIVVKHLSEPAPSVRALRASISEHTEALVARALAKDRAERFADAEALLEAIEALLFGRPAVVEAHPALPARGRFSRTFVFEREMSAPPELLWPYLSHTEKINRALGFAPVQYLQRGIVRGVSERFAQTRALGMNMAWKEEPFEWIEGRKHSVLRTFEQGPLRWYCAETELAKSPSGKTIARHTITVDCRGWLGYLATPLQVGVLYKRSVARVYSALDDLLSRAGALDPAIDPLQTEVTLAPSAERTLADALDTLARRGIDRAVAESIVHFLRVASDLDASRIRPFALARRLRLPSEQVANACIYLADQGSLELLWDVLCPSCQIPSSIAESLDKIAAHGQCPTCNIDFELDFGRSVEAVFRPTPAVRSLETRTFCVGGPGNFPHVIAQLRLAVSEAMDLPLALSEGTYRVRSPQLPYAFELRVRPEAMRRRADLHFSPRPLSAPTPLELCAGEQRLALSNGCERELVLRVERARDESLALTAARASAMRSFRELFGDQVLAPDTLLAVSSVAMLTTMVHDAPSLFRDKGDAQALAVVLEHFRLASDVIAQHGGALLKTVGVQSIAAFDRASNAVEAALALRRALRDKQSLVGLSVRCAVHQGPMIAATLNGRLDYFGHHAELAAALVYELDRPSVLLSQSVADDPSVRAIIAEQTLTSRPRHLRSVGWESWGAEIE